MALYELDSHTAVLTPNDFTVSGRLIDDRERKPVRAVESVSWNQLRPAIGNVEENAVHFAAIAAISNDTDTKPILPGRLASLLPGRFAPLPDRRA
jgi:hypothetical protein